jgi:hypothetical protein
MCTDGGTCAVTPSVRKRSQGSASGHRLAQRRRAALAQSDRRGALRPDGSHVSLGTTTSDRTERDELLRRPRGDPERPRRTLRLTAASYAPPRSAACSRRPVGALAQAPRTPRPLLLRLSKRKHSRPCCARRRSRRVVRPEDAVVRRAPCDRWLSARSDNDVEVAVGFRNPCASITRGGGPRDGCSVVTTPRWGRGAGSLVSSPGRCVLSITPRVALGEVRLSEPLAVRDPQYHQVR